MGGKKPVSFPTVIFLRSETTKQTIRKTTRKQEAFLTQKIDEKKGPQLAIKLFRYKNGCSTLCIILNHMICDAAGFKQLLYLFCEKYNQTTPDGAILIDYGYLQKRKASQAWKDLKLKDFIHFLSRPAMTESPDRSLCIPFDSSLDQILPHMILRTIPERIMGTNQKSYAHTEIHH